MTARRSGIAAGALTENPDVYPLKYARMTVMDRTGKILEAGCGAGRILRYYHGQGHDIFGIDFIDVAVSKLKEMDATLRVEVGDIANLRFADLSLRYVLAFGLYHNLERDLKKPSKKRAGCWRRERWSAPRFAPTIYRLGSLTGWSTGKRGVRVAMAKRGLFMR